MNPNPRTPDGWRDSIRKAGLDRKTTKFALNLADHYDGLPPKEGPSEKDPGYPDYRKALLALEDLGYLKIREREDVEGGGISFMPAMPPAEAPEEPGYKGIIPTVNPTLNSLDEVVKTRPQKPRHPNAPAKRKGVRRQETVLYRYYDAEDVLLYVGVSANMPGRLEGHETDSTWMDFAHRSTLEHFPDRAGAEAAEIAAIETDRPIFNILHNETPDRVRRIVDYLIDRDRRDLLVPLISRG